MEKNYRKIEFGFGDINSAIKELKSHKDLVCGSFNGQMLLGHAHLKTTEIYTHVTTLHLNNIISPFDKLRKNTAA